MQCIELQMQCTELQLHMALWGLRMLCLKANYRRPGGKAQVSPGFCPSRSTQLQVAAPLPANAPACQQQDGTPTETSPLTQG